MIIPNTDNPVPIAGVYIPDLGRRKGAWQMAIRQWEEPDSSIKLVLKDWPEEWYTGKMKNKTAAKQSQTKLVAIKYKQCALGYLIISLFLYSQYAN